MVKYRESYTDLDKAFGDNWDAYVNHYFTFGAKEHRDTGTDFDLATYVEAYEDLQAAYGDNLLGAANHYLKFGQEEERTLINEEAYEEYLNPDSEEDSDSASDSSLSEAPIVKKLGNVDSSAYQKVENAFKSIVQKMREDGIVNAADVCVAMDSTSIIVDINQGDNEVDLLVSQDKDENTYALTLDYDFV